MLDLILAAALLQAAAPACPAIDRDLPPELASWRAPVPAGPVLRPGRAVTVSPSAPLALEIRTAGTYRIAIDQAAWIDVARDGNILRSTAHGHGPACSTIRKIVSFALRPGRHVITFSRTQAQSLRLLVVRQL